MEKTTRMSIALLAVVALMGIVPAPAQAVPESCTSDFTIQEGEPTSPTPLASDSSVTGSITIGTSDSKKVIVELSSALSELRFGAFMDDQGTCKPAEDLTSIDCSDHEVLVTDVNNGPPQAEVCILETPSSGNYEYFFHLVNPDALASVDYRVWSEDHP